MTIVLVADDNVDWTNSASDLLQMHGYAVERAYTGPQAIAALDRMQPDVILLDIGLPPPNGLEVCRHVRGLPWGGKVRVIGVTGWTREREVRAARAVGFDTVLFKPIAFDEILQSLPHP